MTVLKDCIRSADPIGVRWLSVLLSRYQISNARSSSLFKETEQQHSTLESKQIDCATAWVVLDAVAMHLMDFARGEDHTPNVKLDLSKIGSIAYFGDDLTGLPGIAAKIHEAISKLKDNFGDGHVRYFEIRNPFRGQ